jgi:hypothetical protein
MPALSPSNAERAFQRGVDYRALSINFEGEWNQPVY